MWASDIIRIERFDSEGMPVDDTLVLELYLLGSGSFGDSYRALRRTADGDLVDMLEEGVTVEPSLLHHEPGWVVMTIPAGTPLLSLGDASRCGVLEFAVARDFDECLAADFGLKIVQL